LRWVAAIAGGRRPPRPFYLIPVRRMAFPTPPASAAADVYRFEFLTFCVTSS
jgi:hypothetical protein